MALARPPIKCMNCGHMNGFINNPLTPLQKQLMWVGDNGGRYPDKCSKCGENIIQFEQLGPLAQIDFSDLATEKSLSFDRVMMERLLNIQYKTNCMPLKINAIHNTSLMGSADFHKIEIAVEPLENETVNDFVERILTTPTVKNGETNQITQRRLHPQDSILLRVVSFHKENQLYNVEEKEQLKGNNITDNEVRQRQLAEEVIEVIEKGHIGLPDPCPNYPGHWKEELVFLLCKKFHFIKANE